MTILTWIVQQLTEELIALDKALDEKQRQLNQEIKEKKELLEKLKAQENNK